MVQVVLLLLLRSAVMASLFAVSARRKAAAVAVVAWSACWGIPTYAGQADGTARPLSAQPKLDHELSTRAALGASWRQTRVIVEMNGKPLPSELRSYQRAHLDLIDAYVLEL